MRAFVSIAVVSILAAAVAPRSSPAAAQSGEAAYAEAMRKGDELLMRREYMQALQSFRRADALHGALHDRTSAEANLGMARALRALKLHKDVVQACDAGLKYPIADKRLEANLRNFRGEALLALATTADDPKLKDAEADFRASVALSDAMPTARYNLGLALLKQRRDDDGVQALKAYLDVAGPSTDAEEARRLIDNPRRARETYAPDFSIRTLEGKTLTLDALKGKTVVLDFWGTWCAPCVKATPDLVRLNRKLAGQPFVMIGISSDKDDVKWREFIRKNNMDWPQYLDDGSVQRLFDVSAFPTYVLLDADGIVRFRHSGESAASERRLEEEIRKNLSAGAARQ
jgi:thiol-disulfide isomerase/thioredoxin